MEYDFGSSLIAFSVEFHGYKRLQNFILSVLLNYDSRASFLDFSHDVIS